jgi:hypothetical protein
MGSSLSRARIYAQKVRFVGDAACLGGGLPILAAAIREKHYQDAVEISAALTPVLWERLLTVCERLNIPNASVVAFIYSSPHVQAECLASAGDQCTVRFSSAMLDLLREDEFEFVIGHEIGHFLLDHQPIHSSHLNAQLFVQQRSREISADRLGLLACGSLETALRALMKTVSGLTERHLRFDVAAFIAQLRKIEGLAPDWSESTHPSIIIRAKALLWLSMTGFLGNEPDNWSSEEKALLDQRVERDLQRFVDGAIKKQIEETKRDLFLWMMTYEITQTGSFSKNLQLRMRRIFDDDTVDRLLSFVGGLGVGELDEVIYAKVGSTRAQLESLIPQTFEAELGKIRSRIEAELSP